MLNVFKKEKSMSQKLMVGKITLPDLFIIINEELKTVKCELWTAEKIAFRYPFFGINWLLTLDAEKILGKGKLFPVSADGSFPYKLEFHKRILFWNPKFTITKGDVIVFLNEVSKL